MKFMRFNYFLPIILLLTTLNLLAKDPNWFLYKNQLSAAHRNLLQGNESASFDKIVNLLQHKVDIVEKNNLISLLHSAINLDCGRSLSNLNYPTWLKSLSIKRVYSQGINSSYSLEILGVSTSDEMKVSFIKWPNNQIINANVKVQTDGKFVTKKNLDSSISSGLYLIKISNGDKSWTSWVVLRKPRLSFHLGWISDDTWFLQNITLQESICPEPTLQLTVKNINIDDDKDLKVIPLSLVDRKIPELMIPSKQYRVEVGLTFTRFQGKIKIENEQNISEPFMYSNPSEFDHYDYNQN
ncbi:hypothetical protein CF386_10845 [Paraphotobacterium marinum]|uniref:DUF2861 domain-containing protein n=1 Tax=Paraphotobacterium marinum TaxID=1755811 RepID=A0A220VGQ4_9GAMM|nr:DUF2861 family protein [Paraphotobacterium marinum]ASK79545.1 hypothetical protein CF386_10845 [Paraphotobacterium marinum]